MNRATTIQTLENSITSEEVGGMRVNDSFSMEHDGNQWVLIELKEGRRKTGEAMISERKSYYPKLSQACSEILERTAGDCDEIGMVLKAFNDSVYEIRQAIEKAV